MSSLLELKRCVLMKIVGGEEGIPVQYCVGFCGHLGRKVKVENSHLVHRSVGKRVE
jgi:hypothetical protein